MDEIRLMAKVAKMYYEENLTQEEIAHVVNISRPRVSKLIKRAREMGYIRIVLDFPDQNNVFLEREVEKLYGLKECVIVDRVEDIGPVGAKYLQEVLKESEIVGVSWGVTLESVVKHLSPFQMKVRKVVQIVGGLGRPEEDYHAVNLAKEFARKLEAEVALLPAPGIAKSIRIKKAFLSDFNVTECLEKIKDVTTALVGIGSLHEKSTLVSKGKILSKADRRALISAGCVGDIALVFFNKDGKPIDLEISKRVIGVTYDQLKRIGRVIAFAGGLEKVEAIRGALKGGLITNLVTDKSTAKELLSYEKGGRK